MGNPNAMMRTILWWAPLLTGLLIRVFFHSYGGTVVLHPRFVSDGDE